MEKISFSDWQKLDLRVGKILEVEEIEGSDKLYKLKVDIEESEPRTLVAGLKKNYDKKKLKGKKIIVIANLESSKIRGVISNGMLLAAVSEDESKIVLLEPESEIETGTRIR